MSCRFVSPYLPAEQDCRWLRGNHHGHTTLSDGADDPAETLQAYEAAGYDYLALSEHDLLADPADYQPLTRMTLLPAVEITSRAEQTLMYLGARRSFPEARRLSLGELSAWVAAAGGLFVADHPNWLYLPMRRHLCLAELLAAPAVGAMEIYTGVIERLPGEAGALDLWDRLLSSGRVVYGHAVDDQHAAQDRFLGWNVVQWPAGAAVTAGGIVEALRLGRFYASTGVRVSRLALSADGGRVEIASDASRIRWLVRDGRLAAQSDGGAATLALEELAASPLLNHPWRSFEAPEEMLYLRAELLGDGGRRAWTQPFFIEPAA